MVKCSVFRDFLYFIVYSPSWRYSYILTINFSIHVQMANKVLALLLLMIGVFTLVEGNVQCPWNCNCGVQSVFCSKAINPRFSSMLTVLHVYMEKGIMANLTHILLSFPHMKTLQLKDMTIDCSQLTLIPSRVYLMVTGSCDDGMY